MSETSPNFEPVYPLVPFEQGILVPEANTDADASTGIVTILIPETPHGGIIDWIDWIVSNASVNAVVRFYARRNNAWQLFGDFEITGGTTPGNVQPSESGRWEPPGGRFVFGPRQAIGATVSVAQNVVLSPQGGRY